MIDLAVVGDVATGVGTLVLAVATFASVRSANASARTAERALAAGLRPLLLPSHRGDESLKVRFGDGHYVRVDGAMGSVEITDDVGLPRDEPPQCRSGDGDHPRLIRRHRDRPRLVVRRLHGAQRQHHARIEDFRLHGRDVYVPGGDNSFWQGAIREEGEPARDIVAQQLAGNDAVTVDVLYGDVEGGQQIVSRFTLTPMPDSPAYLLSSVRHWNVDGRQPY